MASKRFETNPNGTLRHPNDHEHQAITEPGGLPTSVKIVVAGGFGVGKTTFVASISEIEPLTTEAMLTEASEGIDNLAVSTGKSSTTVAMDFGRISLAQNLILYLFGTPGQPRFHFMWDDLARGAIGAVVLVDSNRLEESFAAVDYFEERDLPFVVAHNVFHDDEKHTLVELQEALAVSDTVPMIACDARSRESTKAALITLVQHALSKATA